MVKEISMLSLFEQFIKESKNGKRRKLNGEKLQPLTVSNYSYVLKYLKDFETATGKYLRIKVNIRNNLRIIRQEQNYWRSFYREFSDFLYCSKKCHDNFVGSVFKNIKCFFRYLRNEKFLMVPECYESFYVRRENIRIIALLPDQFCNMILNKNLESTLSTAQKRVKDMFVFGCISAMRFSDLVNLRIKNIENINDKYFLVYDSLKTSTPVHVKLPAFAVDIFNKYAKYKHPENSLFNHVALSNFNKNLKAIARLAGYNNNLSKERSINGKSKELKTIKGKSFCFCDQLSSHVMRRTGITLLLMLGMPELVVRKISGHAAHSKEFFRYVNFAQSYITDEIDKVHQNLFNLYRY